MLYTWNNIKFLHKSHDTETVSTVLTVCYKFDDDYRKNSALYFKCKWVRDRLSKHRTKLTNVKILLRLTRFSLVAFVKSNHCHYLIVRDL